MCACVHADTGKRWATQLVRSGSIGGRVVIIQKSAKCNQSLPPEQSDLAFHGQVIVTPPSELSFPMSSLDLLSCAGPSSTSESPTE